MAGLLLAASISLVARAQPAADSAWQSLQTLAAPTGPASPQLASASTVPVSPLEQEISRLQQAAQAANAFYTAYPTDPRAAAARKLEAMSGLEALQLGATQGQASALGVAQAFVQNSANAVQDRFDVALTLGLVSQADGIRGQSPAVAGPAYAKLADSLHAEFGDAAPVYHYYVALTRIADPATAVQIAAKLQTMNAPAWAKAQTQGILNRQKLIGSPVPITLTTASGQTLNLSAPSGQPTILYIWGGASALRDLAALSVLKGSVPSGVRWVYLALNSPSPSEQAAGSAAPFPGTQCFDPVNLAGFVPRELGVLATPCAYVLDAQGRLSGFGEPSDIPALLAAAK